MRHDRRLIHRRRPIPKGLADRWSGKPLSSITADDVHWIIDEVRERCVPGLKRSGNGC
jgi:hypothetical protein